MLLETPNVTLFGNRVSADVVRPVLGSALNSVISVFNDKVVKTQRCTERRTPRETEDKYRNDVSTSQGTPSIASNP